MKCIKCKKSAEIYIPHHKTAFCREHFVEYFEKKVFKAIKKWKMFSKKDKIVVAVSGGKDSLALWFVLNKHGYKADGLYINLGIGEYSKNSYEKVKKFAKIHNLNLIVEDVKDYFYGLSIGEISKILKIPPCRLCGKVKRYIMDRTAKKYDVIATGHNLDDEASALLGNLLHWKIEYLKGKSPVLPEENGFSKKVKPFVLLGELETAIYCFVNDIDYIDEECPHSKGATTLFYKEIINTIEKRMRGTKVFFLTQYYESGILENTNESKKNKTELKKCKICGYPTTQEICSFCRLRERVKIYIEENKK